jgi:hypothetical protein
MSGLRQTWHHSERAAVAGVRLLGIGVLLLAVAVLAIYKFNPNKKPDSPTTTTTASTTTSTTEPPTTTTTLPLETLKCDNQKYALVGTPGSPVILPTDLRETAEKFGKQALIVSPQLCDAVGASTTYTGPRELIFIGPFDDVETACGFISAIAQSQSSITSEAANPEPGSLDLGFLWPLPTQPPTAQDWTVHNIRDLTSEFEDCEGNS